MLAVQMPGGACVERHHKVRLPWTGVYGYGTCAPYTCSPLWRMRLRHPGSCPWHVRHVRHVRHDAGLLT